MDTPFSYLESAAVTDVGRRRKNNEDALVALPACGARRTAGTVSRGGAFRAVRVARNDRGETPCRTISGR